jgi:hypothetical protein
LGSERKQSVAENDSDFWKTNIKKITRMTQRNFINSWLLPCSLRSHRTANPRQKNGLRHFSALPTHHPTSGWHNVKENFAHF